jgi:hypothetical protein
MKKIMFVVGVLVVALAVTNVAEAARRGVQHRSKKASVRKAPHTKKKSTARKNRGVATRRGGQAASAVRSRKAMPSGNSFDTSLPTKAPFPLGGHGLPTDKHLGTPLPPTQPTSVPWIRIQPVPVTPKPPVVPKGPQIPKPPMATMPLKGPNTSIPGVTITPKAPPPVKPLPPNAPGTLKPNDGGVGFGPAPAVPPPPPKPAPSTPPASKAPPRPLPSQKGIN